MFKPKIILVDLTGRFPQYTSRLYKALKELSSSVHFASINSLDPKDGLTLEGDFNLLEIEFLRKNRRKQTFIHQLFKLLEIIVNVFYLEIQKIKIRPQVIHYQYFPLIEHFPLIEFTFLKFNKYLGIKTVYTVHNILPHNTGDRFKSIYNKLYSLCDILIVHTIESSDQLVNEFNVDKSKVQIIPHGELSIDSDKIKKPYKYHKNLCKNKVVLCFGRISRYKGIEKLLDAFALLSNTRTTLLIAGNGDDSYLNELKLRSQSKKIQNVIFDNRFIPESELHDMFDITDVVVFPYSKITQSGAVLMALSQGKAIICSDLLAFHELLENEVQGEIINCDNSDLLCRRIKYILNNKDYRLSLGINAKKMISKRYNWKSIANLTIKTYQNEFGQF